MGVTGLVAWADSDTCHLVHTHAAWLAFTIYVNDRFYKGDFMNLSSRPHPDGPMPPIFLWWNGIRHSLSPREWQILSAVWEKEHFQIQDLCDLVWGEDGDQVADVTVRATVCRLNQRLLRIGIPWRLYFKRGFLLRSCNESTIRTE